MTDAIAPFITTFVSSIVPGTDINLKLQTGIFAGELYRQAAKHFRIPYEYIPFLPKKNEIFIAQYLADGHRNPVFEQLEEYIIRKNLESIRVATLVPKKGELNLYPRKGLSVTDAYSGKTLTIAMGSADSDEDEMKKASRAGQISISSTSLKTSDLKEYVKSICKLDRNLHTTITVYRSLQTAQGKKK